MFPPMDRLRATGKSLEDLEENRRVVPAWRNRATLLGVFSEIILDIFGSSLVATFYSLHSLFNTVQIFALILDTIVPFSSNSSIESWRQLFMGTIPNVIALNFGSSLTTNVVLLVFFSLLSGILLFFFSRETSTCAKLARSEGFQGPKRTGGWGLIVTTFLLTIIYLPLSTVAVHVMTWSDDLWVVPNPYTNATTSPPVVASLGPAAEYRDPLDFCWTTTMRKDQVNFAPVIVILAIALFFSLSVWFPITLNRAINRAAPKVNPYTSLGKIRTGIDLDLDYQRVLDRDLNPLSFIYHSFRRGWATYESIYLLAKLSALLIIAVIDPNNCLFRTLPSQTVMLIRQCTLLAGTVVFFTMQCLFTPFLDPLGNASEWMSRFNYVLTSIISLLVVLGIPGKDIIGGPVLYVVYIVTYGFTVYFTVIDWSWVQNLVKRIDIFSPRIDLTPSSPHLRRRIWQESVSTLILTDTDCRIPREQAMRFIKGSDLEYPPYLLEFLGSPGERHVENLEILREIGSYAYSRASSLASGPDFEWFRGLVREIQESYVGPDSYWHDPAATVVPGRTRFFGNAWLLPFPPTLVIKYDDGGQAVLRDLADLQLYVTQNSGSDVRRRREIRLALRALDGQEVFWPHRHVQNSYSRWWCCGSRYQAKSVISYQVGRLSIKRKGYALWDGMKIGSGFDITIKYARGVVCSSSIFGLNDHYDLTEHLARFFSLNRQTIAQRLPEITTKLKEYRIHFAREFRDKASVLSYAFLTQVYDRPRHPIDLVKDVLKTEKDLRVRQLLAGSDRVFEITYDRLSAVSMSEVAVWWYIFWDDFWRRNHDAIKALRLHSTEFDPHYPSSIAYTPLPRAALEAFLTQRGLLNARSDFIHSGLLNKIYIRLYDIVYHGSRKGEIFHLGEGASEVDLEEIDLETQANPSTMGTGNGTDHDDTEIRQRPYFRWEGILNDPFTTRSSRHRHGWLSKLGPWLGITPQWRAGVPSPGVALDVKLEGERYVLI
ncbi:hypothetical protein K488DRAFT_78307 [Vararia minispora EC-137]|uniref:Uncharacterized protein n=1 Tax=Vararia minispora EC-137 TaxID=1314806 RepID=A0ACB8QLN9_9AGAM|nr:hypothetical protein K488DRAFT_78307 [Vararia minispora EC-137]